MHFNRITKLYIVLSSIFLTFLLMAELTGSKLITTFGFVMTMGVIPFPITFIVTDILNEFYGKKGVRFTTFLGMAMILLAYFLIVIDLQIPANSISPVDDVSFQKVFANSGLVIIGSITAYLIGQLIDIQIFHFIRTKTGGRHVWLRATGSTVISQLIDSYVVIFIAFGKYEPTNLFGLPFYSLINTPTLVSISTTNFVYKLCIAILLTPLIYLSHSLIERYLGDEIIHLHHRD